MSATNDPEPIGIGELEIFVEFARTEHLGRTAHALGRSVSSIQRTVRALETRLAVPLVERDGRRVRLLFAGRVLAEQAARVLRARSEAVRAVQAASGPRIAVRLGHMFSLGLTIVPQIARTVLQRDPAARLVLRHGPTNALVAAVLAGELDAALVSPPPLAADLVPVAMFSERVLLAVAAGDPLAARASVGLADVRDRPFVALPEGAGSRYDLVQACARAGFVPDVAIEVDDMFTLEAMVGAGLGVSVVPESMRAHAHPAVARLTLDDPVETRRQIALVYVRGTEARRPVAALLAAAQEVEQPSVSAAATRRR